MGRRRSDSVPCAKRGSKSKNITSSKRSLSLFSFILRKLTLNRMCVRYIRMDRCSPNYLRFSGGAALDAAASIRWCGTKRTRQRVLYKEYWLPTTFARSISGRSLKVNPISVRHRIRCMPGPGCPIFISVARTLHATPPGYGCSGQHLAAAEPQFIGGGFIRAGF